MVGDWCGALRKQCSGSVNHHCHLENKLAMWHPGINAYTSGQQFCPCECTRGGFQPKPKEMYKQMLMVAPSRELGPDTSLVPMGRRWRIDRGLKGCVTMQHSWISHTLKGNTREYLLMSEEPISQVCIKGEKLTNEYFLRRYSWTMPVPEPTVLFQCPVPSLDHL